MFQQVAHRPVTEPTLLAEEPSVGASDYRARKTRVFKGIFGESLDSVTIGRFTLDERIAVGGMGEVFSAYDEMIAQKVAIKLVRTDVRLGPEAEARLFREAQTLARVNHPNVVKIVEADRVGDRAFVAMEFISGVTLGQWLDERREAGRPASIAEIVQVFGAAGRGLSAAHKVGLVHRDFKPSNVLIDEHGHVRVVDFGLARSVEPSGSEPAGAASVPTGSWVGDEPDATTAAGWGRCVHSRASLRMGTPYYMSPEQIRCDAIDQRSDQFSFCVALYEALFGHSPYQGRNREERWEAVKNGLRVEVPRRSPVPANVRRALARGMATEPDQRFATMDELLAALACPTPQPANWHASIFGGLIAFIICAALWGLSQWHSAPAMADEAWCQTPISQPRAIANDSLADGAWACRTPRRRAGARRVDAEFQDLSCASVSLGGSGEAAVSTRE